MILWTPFITEILLIALLVCRSLAAALRSEHQGFSGGAGANNQKIRHSPSYCKLYIIPAVTFFMFTVRKQSSY